MPYYTPHNPMEAQFYKHEDRLKRKRLRDNTTVPERMLWARLKGHQLFDCKFRRQASIGRYVVDFYAPSQKLIIELDGESHFVPGAQEYDAERTVFLESLGLRIVRFFNREVISEIEGVIERIGGAMEEKMAGQGECPAPPLTPPR